MNGSFFRVPQPRLLNQTWPGVLRSVGVFGCKPVFGRATGLATFRAKRQASRQPQAHRPSYGTELVSFFFCAKGLVGHGDDPPPASQARVPSKRNGRLLKQDFPANYRQEKMPFPQKERAFLILCVAWPKPCWYICLARKLPIKHSIMVDTPLRHFYCQRKCFFQESAMRRHVCGWSRGKLVNSLTRCHMRGSLKKRAPKACSSFFGRLPPFGRYRPMWAMIDHSRWTSHPSKIVVARGCPLWLIWFKDRGPWCTWWFKQLPGPSIFPKRTPIMVARG